MKKILFVSCLALALSAPAFAGGYGSAGCGVGSAVTSQPGLIQLFPWTTNVILWPITGFAITSGTSNCGGSGGIASNETEKNLYVFSNHDVLTQEMAQGGGEHLNAFSALMGCNEASSALFARAMKQNYRKIASDSPEQLLENVKSTVSSDPVLKQACNS